MAEAAFTRILRIEKEIIEEQRLKSQANSRPSKALAITQLLDNVQYTSKDHQQQRRKDVRSKYDEILLELIAKYEKK